VWVYALIGGVVAFVVLAMSITIVVVRKRASSSSNDMQLNNS
jgi:hypothetical protein